VPLVSSKSKLTAAQAGRPNHQTAALLRTTQQLLQAAALQESCKLASSSCLLCTCSMQCRAGHTTPLARPYHSSNSRTKP
jgi:hypothetical protein